MYKLYEKEFNNRLILGSALFPSPKKMIDSFISSEVEIITVSLRRNSPESNGGEDFWSLIKERNYTLLPNTAGCRSSEEAIETAYMARELFGTDWLKLEVVNDDYYLHPDPLEIYKAARVLHEKGFKIFPYITEDLVLAEKLVDLGLEILMPWAGPIGSGKGIRNPQAIKTLRNRFPNIPIIIDAGIGKPSHAALAMELGCDAVLLNSAVALSHDPVSMAQAFNFSIKAGRMAFEAGVMPERDFGSPSTSIVGRPFEF